MAASASALPFTVPMPMASPPQPWPPQLVTIPAAVAWETVAQATLLPFATPVALPSTSTTQAARPASPRRSLSGQLPFPARPASPRARVASPARQYLSPFATSRELPTSPTEMVRSSPKLEEALRSSPKLEEQRCPFPQRYDAGLMLAAQPREEEDAPERRLADPFFYPTTARPLTSYIDQATPQVQKVGSMERLMPQSARSVWQDAPLPNLMNAHMEARALQQQGDCLAKQVQALEHAKSLAAVQSAQAMQKIRIRQEQLRKEAEHAVLSFKEMQAELPLSSREHLGESPRAPAAPPSPSGTAWKETVDQPLWSQDIWQEMPTATSRQGFGSHTDLNLLVPQMSSPSGSTTRSEHGPAVAHERSTARGAHEAQVAHERHVVEVHERAVHAAHGGHHFTPPASNTERSRPKASPKSAHRTPRGSEHAQESAGQQEDTYDLPNTLLSTDAQPDGITAMANRILMAHNTPLPPGPLLGGGLQPQAPIQPNRGPYVDAMGNPLGPTTQRELPNIKDDFPTAALPDLGQGLVAPVGSLQQVQASSAQTLFEALEPPLLGKQHAMDTGHELLATDSELLPVQAARTRESSSSSAAATAVVHERAMHSGRAQRVPGTDTEAVARVSPATTAQPQTQTVGAADAAAGSAAAPPPAASPPSTSRPPLPANSPAQGRSSSLKEPRSAPRSPRATASPRRDRPARAENTARSRQRNEEERPERARRDRSPPKAASGSASNTANAAAKEGASASASANQQLRNLPPNASEELQAELEECLDMIRWCGVSLARESLQDLKNTARPPGIVKDVLEAVALLLGQPEDRWERLKKLLASPTFLERVQKLNFQQTVSREVFRILRDRLQQPEFDEEHIKSVCVPVVPLAMWCRAIGVYLSKTKFRGGPEIRPVAGAGAATPPSPQHQKEQRPPTPVADMDFEPDIRAMGPEELRCVQNLAISRPDVGSILFHGTTDCSFLDFERIVRLEIGEVLVYPDSSLKPSVGVDLNKPATVTMYQCWPPNGSRALQDAGSQDRYKDKIKKMTEEKNAEFLDYDCSTGIWKFSIEHF